MVLQSSEKMKDRCLINAGNPSRNKIDPRIYLTADDLPDGDRIVTYVRKFDYISPEDALIFKLSPDPTPTVALLQF